MPTIRNCCIYNTEVIILVGNWIIRLVYLFTQMCIMLYIIFFVFLYSRNYLSYDSVTGVATYRYIPYDGNLSTPYPYCDNPYPCTEITPNAFARHSGVGIHIASEVLINQYAMAVKDVENIRFVVKTFIVAEPGFPNGIDDRDIEMKFVGTADPSMEIDFPKGSDTAFNLSTFLKFAGISLDSHANHTTEDNRTIRESGAVMLGVITYSNYRQGFTSTPLEHITGTGRVYFIHPSGTEMLAVIDPETQGVRSVIYTGISVGFILSGNLARFDGIVCMVHLVSSVALFSVATLVVDKVFFSCFFKNLAGLKYKSNVVHFMGFTAGCKALFCRRKKKKTKKDNKESTKDAKEAPKENGRRPENGERGRAYHPDPELGDQEDIVTQAPPASPTGLKMDGRRFAPPTIVVEPGSEAVIPLEGIGGEGGKKAATTPSALRTPGTHTPSKAVKGSVNFAAIPHVDSLSTIDEPGGDRNPSVDSTIRRTSTQHGMFRVETAYSEDLRRITSYATTASTTTAASTPVKPRK